MDILALLAGAATGAVLGIFGSGGSIVALPALLYLLHVEPKSAIAMSLGVVATTAAITAVRHWRRGNVDIRVALVFGLFGMTGSFAGTRLGLAVPVTLQLGLFALVMYAAAWRMLRQPSPRPGPDPGIVLTSDGVAALRCQAFFSPCMGRIALHGIGVGALTGLVGVGGGFLIVPALVLLSRIPMKQAIGTSLAIVAANSSAGFAGYLGSVSVDYGLMASFTAITVLGSFVGARVAHRLSPEALKKAFALFLLLVASHILLKNVLGAGVA